MEWRKYTIVSGTISELQDRVGEKLEKGYKCQGGVTKMGKREDGIIILAQAMVKDDN